MHHALLSLMLMSGACGEAPASTQIVTPAPVVERCELPGVLKILFVPRESANANFRSAERRSADCQAM
jgi:hypothetical protein